MGADVRPLMVDTEAGPLTIVNSNYDWRDVARLVVDGPAAPPTVSSAAAPIEEFVGIPAIPPFASISRLRGVGP